MTFRIGGTNWSQYIVESSYAINSVPEYGGTEYMDGWWKKHRTVVRNRVTGTVTLAMRPSVYTTFLNSIKTSQTSEGDNLVNLYVLNEGEQKEIYAYVTVEGKAALATKAFYGDPVFFNAVVTIEER